jgi:hypothetical protein
MIIINKTMILEFMKRLNINNLQKREKWLFAFSLVLLALFGCENEPFLYKAMSSLYLSGDPAQNATDDSVYYSFRIYDFSLSQKDLNLKVNVTGKVADHDRTLSLEIVDSATNVPPSAYRIGELIIPAKAYYAMIPITVFRKVEGLDLTKQNARLTLKVANNENYREGVSELTDYTIVWCDFLTQPNTWSVISYYIGPFSQARFKFIIDFTGYISFESFTTSSGGTDYNKLMWFQGRLNDLLIEYNADPANANRPEGWPYRNDNGTPLQFGSGLQN